MSTTTSDTPRTDAAITDGSYAGTYDRVTANFARGLERELAQAKAYSQQVVVNITEEMNQLKAGNARLLWELEELRGLRPLLKRARDALKECVTGQDENPELGSPWTTDEQRAVLNDLDAAIETSK